MSRGLSRQQQAIIEHLQNVERITTNDLVRELYPGKLFSDGTTDWSVHSSVLRALQSLEKRGLVVKKGLVRGEDTRWTQWSDDEWKDGYVIFGRPIHRAAPTREMTWMIAPLGYTPMIAAQKTKDNKANAWFIRIRKQAVAFADLSELGPGEDDAVYENQDIVINLCNYTDNQRLLTVDERNRGHSHVVGIECSLYDIGYFRKSGFTAIEAMRAALEELGRKLASAASNKPSCATLLECHRRLVLS